MSRPPTTPQKPTVAMSDIPSVGELCNQLGFKSAPNKAVEQFQETSLEFIQSHESQLPKGLKSLLEWNSITVEWDLEEMAVSFLSEGNYGDRFWGSKRTWGADGLRYPEDEDRIILLLMQLFWRQNMESFSDQDGNTQSQAKYTSRENATQVSEDIQRHRLASSSSTLRRETPDQQTSILDRKGKSILKPSPASGSKAARIADVFDGPEDDDIIRNAQNFFSKDDQADTNSRLETPPSGINTRKRKAPGIDRPRRSDRARKPIERPDFVPPDDIEDLSSDRSVNRSLEQSIERDEEFDRDSPLKMVLPLNKSTNQNIDPDVVGASQSVRKSLKAPTAPMTPSAKKSKTSWFEAKISKPSSSSSKVSEKPQSTSTDTTTRKQEPPLVGKSIWKPNIPWNMPGTKAQSKPLGKKLPVEVHAKTPPNREEERTHSDFPASPGGDNSSPHSSQPPTPTIESSQPPPLSLAAGVTPASTPLHRPATVEVPPPPTPTPLSQSATVQTWVITHSPKRTEEWWHHGKLTGTSFSSFLSNLAAVTSRPVNDIDKVKLTLDMPLLNTKITVGKGEEEIWGWANKVFRERLSVGDRKEQCKILIEPVWVEEKAEDRVRRTGDNGGSNEGESYDL